MAKESIKAKKERVLLIIERLHQRYPDTECTLDYRDKPFRLLVGAILAAQCTDARVNMVTPGLFERYPEQKDLANAEATEIEPYIKSCGLFRMKAKNIQAAAAYLLSEHEGELPSTEKELLKIPGVGRKIANLILGESFGKQAVVVDTHCARISRLLGLTDSDKPAQIEKDLIKVLPESEWTNWGHLMVAHGREVCIARRPRCENCVVQDLCPHGKNQSDGK